MGVKSRYFLIAALLAFLVAFFDGITLALLAPLAKGIIMRDFTFLETAPVFKIVIAWFPHALSETPAKFLFVLLVGTIFTAAIMKNVLEYTSSLYISAKREEFSLRLKKFIFNRYLSFGKLFFDKTSQGHIGGTLGFVDRVAKLFDILNRAFKAAITLAVYLTIMLVISWKLTIFVVTIFPVLHYCLTWVVKKIKKVAELQTATTLRLSREIFNILSCITLVKAYNKEQETKRKFGEINEDLKRWNFSMAKKQNLIAPLQDIIMLVGILLLISATAYVFLKKQTGDVSGFLVVLYLARRSLPLFASFNSIRASFATIEAPMKRLSEVLNDDNKFFVPSGNKEFEGLKQNIEFRNVNFSYAKERPILNDINSVLKKGKMTAIVGPTGAGKTTIISLIMRFYDCTPSSIFLDGVDIRELSLKSLRRHMAFVSQDALHLNDTLKNNITFGIEKNVTEEKLVDATKKARLLDFITSLPRGFDTEVGDRGVRLSGGEKQRLSIARALLKEADILILDEATSSLDTKTEKTIQAAIEEAVKGRTTIVIAHRLSTIKNADKIIVIENGEIKEEGTLNGLLEKKGKFYEYWEEQKFY